MNMAAALIIACSNLIQGDNYHGPTVAKVTEVKVACIARVTACTKTVKGLLTDADVLYKCSDKVF